jgi:hypothetical protein
VCGRRPGLSSPQPRPATACPVDRFLILVTLRNWSAPYGRLGSAFGIMPSHCCAISSNVAFSFGLREIAAMRSHSCALARYSSGLLIGQPSSQSPFGCWIFLTSSARRLGIGRAPASEYSLSRRPISARTCCIWSAFPPTTGRHFYAWHRARSTPRRHEPQRPQTRCVPRPPEPAVCHLMQTIFAASMHLLRLQMPPLTVPENPLLSRRLSARTLANELARRFRACSSPKALPLRF